MDFKNIDKKYRPVPFWSWNEKLSVEESLRQTAIMDEAGMGGYFMHARGGLQTEYMGDEWFDNVGACIEECNRRGMHAWAYDENGWPSGFGDGRVNGKGEKFWQKYLRVMPASADRSAVPEHRIIKLDDKYCFYYDVNPFYVDTLDADVTADFIREIYEPYYEKYGNSFDGFFTDEPQISRGGIPWSLTLIDAYRTSYGEELSDVLACLFYAEGDFENVRIKFWKLVTELFSRNFMKQIYDWCTSRGLEFTGHLVLEDHLRYQLISNGACMPHYEYLTIPGMDWLGRNIEDCLTHHQVASVAAQLGKEQILSETFALCGHNVGHDELKRNYEWMTVRGINLMCQHLEGYSLRGLRKRDYPPAMYHQQPWWHDYKVFNDAMSRVGMILAKGKICFDTLILHNMASAWVCYDNAKNEYRGKDIKYYDSKLLEAISNLEAKHVPFHLGDEILMERHGRVEGNKLIIGEMAYTRVVVPEHITFMENTNRLLEQFKKNGGILTVAEEIEPSGIVDNPNITYTWRSFDGFTVDYYVNSQGFFEKAKFSRGSYAIDIATGDKVEFTGEYTFAPYESLVVVDDGTPRSPIKEPKPLRALDISGDWDVASSTYNSLTLDKCTYWFDGELQEENGYVLNVVQRAVELERPVKLRAEFKVNIEYIPSKLYLACETPEIFTIKINGKEIEKVDCGCFRDSAFRMLDISEAVAIGENTIELTTQLAMSEKTYENVKKAKIFESERNKLTYDMEFEAMYLVGDFGVRCDGNFDKIERDASFYDGSFTVIEPSKTVTLRNIERQGFTFFSGELTVSRTFELDATDYKLDFVRKGINALRIKVNGKDVGTVMWAPYSVDLSGYLTKGKNVVELTLVNNLRNLLGPHHHTSGELYGVGPAHFYSEPCVWNGFSGGYYTEKYCFVDTGLI